MNPVNIFTKIIFMTILLIVANIVGGSLNAMAEDGNQWQWNILRDSLVKYLGILLVASLLYGAGFLGDEVLTDYTNEYMNLKNLVSVGLAAYAVDRAKDASVHWVKLIGVKIKKDED